MLTVYRSNRAELLAQLLATQLRLHPPDPFERLEVVVNTWPTSRWLGEQLAIHLGGIAAHVRFPFPASHLRGLVDRLLEPEGGEPEGSGTNDPWRAERLVWPLLEALPSVAEAAGGEPLRRWLDGRDPCRRLDPAGWQFGRAIADAFDDYALYRPGMLAAWERGLDHDGRGAPLPQSQTWQPLLHRHLRRRLGRDPFAERVERLIERLRSEAPPPAGLPAGPLRLFGISTLAPAQVRLLQALSGRMAVDLYLLTPCRDLWQRCTDRRRALSDALALELPLEETWLLGAPGLEARFGRLGAEFQQLLEGTGEAQLGEWEERDLFFAPATSKRRAAPDRPPPLLAQLQEQLADPGAAGSLVLDPGDDSLEFHPCPGRLRQVQIVRDRVLQLLASDPGLEPRDVLVMTPRVEHYAPLVASVFGDQGATGVALPWRLTDRSQQSEAGISRTLLALLAQAGERFTASGLETLLDCPPLLRRFDLKEEEAGRLLALLQRAGLRWGLDAEERHGDPLHSLGWVIDRLLLGLVLPDTPGLAPSETAPLATFSSLDLSGRWLHLLLRLRQWLAELRRSCGVEAWAERLRQLLADLFEAGGDDGELTTLLAAIDTWQEAAADYPGALEAPVVAAVLEEGLAVDSGRFGHRSGALTISALEPMRAIPHRVVVLMGLDAEAFPRHRPRPGFHLMERDRRLGDPDPSDQDRYVLMEALLSARDHLLVCWNCRDDRSGEDLPPAGPVRQWQEWLEASLGEAARHLSIDHPASPLDRRNFLPAGGRPPASCDRRLLASRRLLEARTLTPAAALIRTAMPEAGELPPAEAEDPFSDLRGWLIEPQRHWLRGLGLRPAEWEESIADLEALELDERERARLLRQVLEDHAPEAPGPPPGGSATWWLEWSRGRGLLPAGAGGALEARTLEGRCTTLRELLGGLGPASRDPLGWGPWQAAPLRHGRSVVIVHPATAQTPQRMDLWIQLLLAVAGEGTPPPERGVLIARDGEHRDRFTVELELTAPAVEAARAELERLAALREEWRGACWPVPPRTAWAWLEGEARRSGGGHSPASQQWEGGAAGRGPMAERRRAEMVVCFGADLPAEDLLEGDFGERAAALYGPLLEARPERRR